MQNEPPVGTGFAPWDAPELTSINRLPMHAVPAPDRMILDGVWDFQLQPDPLATRGATWRSIDVPGLWTMQGADDRPHYTNIATPFEAPYPHPPRSNPTGVFRRRFTAGEWAGRRVVLHVGAAESVLLVRLNGADVGISKDSHLAAEFDITAYLQPGENELELTVVKWSDATYIEDQDHWWHGGVTRSVYIYTTGITHLADLRVVADFDPDAVRGHLAVEVEVADALGDLRGGWTVRTRVAGLCEAVEAPVPVRRSVATAIPPREAPGDYPADPPASQFPEWALSLLALSAAGATLSQTEQAIARLSHETAFPPRGGYVHLRFDDLDARPWSAEDPQLYELHVELVSPENQVVQRATARIGFRRVEVRGRDLLVNGRRVWIQGVNRHDVNSRTGRVITREQMVSELLHAPVRRHQRRLRRGLGAVAQVRRHQPQGVVPRAADHPGGPPALTDDR